jgi:hypothetical protein
MEVGVVKVREEKMWEESRSEKWCSVENVVAGNYGWWLAVVVSGGGEWWWREFGCATRCGSDDVQRKLFGVRGAVLDK